MSDSDSGDDSDVDRDDMMYLMSGAAEADSDDAEEDEPMGDWNVIKDYETSIEIGLVDRHLLEVARNEVPIVLNRLRVKLFGGTVRHLHNIAPA
jgi:hypothetical protein